MLDFRLGSLEPWRNTRLLFQAYQFMVLHSSFSKLNQLVTWRSGGQEVQAGGLASVMAPRGKHRGKLKA